MSSPHVIIYSRDGCHLCEEAERMVRMVQSKLNFSYEVVNIDSDPKLQQQFQEEVPVVFINGRKAFKYRIDERQLLRLLKNGG